MKGQWEVAISDISYPSMYQNVTEGKFMITTGQYMNYPTFGNLQSRPLLENFFHSVHIDLRDKSVEKIPFVSAGVICLVLMFSKVSNIHF